MLRRVLLIVALSLVAGIASGQRYSHTTRDGDTFSYSYTPIDQTYDTTTSGRGFGRSLSRYLSHGFSGPSGTPRFVLFGGPGYSNDTGWRLSLFGSMSYLHGRYATPSTLSLTAAASLTGYYRIALAGSNPLGRHRLDYQASFHSMPTYFWGIDYATASGDSRGSYTSRELSVDLDYGYALTSRLSVGAAVRYRNTSARNMDSYTTAALGNESHHLSLFGLGLGLSYDSRDSRANSTRGLYVAAAALIYPQPFGTARHTLYQASLTFDYFQPLWRGATLCFDLYGEAHSADTPWLACAELGDNSRMRGYYPGRFRGERLLTAQLELRQHIVYGLGLAAWGGYGMLHSHGDKLSWHSLLPTYGIGLRWGMGNGSGGDNSGAILRLDLGFGRHSHTFTLGLSQAF